MSAVPLLNVARTALAEANCALRDSESDLFMLVLAMGNKETPPSLHYVQAFVDRVQQRLAGG